MARGRNSLAFRFLYSVYFYAVFLAISHLFFWYGHLRYGHFRRSREIEAWRLLAHKLVDTIFDLCGIRVTVRGREHIPSGAVIFCANHQSYLDGLIVLHAVRKPFTAVTGPFSIFPHIIREWFAHMGYISVSRDVFEELRYKSAVHHENAIATCVDTLKGGVPLLIFPEGRREYKKQLLPFHLGVAKIALGACAPVVPITLKHVDTLFPTHQLLLTPASIDVTILPPVALWEISPNILEDVMFLEKEIQRHLPKSYFSERSIPHLPHGGRAVFFDLDDTLTRQNIYREVVLRYLFRHVSTGNVLKIPRLAAKRLLLKHGRFYLAAIRLLAGIPADDFMRGFYSYLKEHKNRIFYSEMIRLLEQHRKLGNKIFLISEEPEEIMAPVGNLLNVPFCATVVEKRDGVFTGRVVGHILKDEFKRDCVIELAKKHHLDLVKSYAYGDSWHDVPMLRSVGHAALVNPSKKLAHRGTELGMRIIHEK